MSIMISCNTCNDFFPDFICDSLSYPNIQIFCSPLHNVLFVQYNSPVIKIIFGLFKTGQNNLQIANLEFENYGFLDNDVFPPTEQAGTNMC